MGIYSFAYVLQMNDEKLSEHIDLLKGKVIHHAHNDSSDEFEEEGKHSEPAKIDGQIEMQAIVHH